MNSHLILIVTSCEQAYVWEGHGDAAEVPPDSSPPDLFARAYEKMGLVTGYSLGDLRHDL